MFRRIFTISILFILLVNITGYYPLFKLEQMQIRKEIKEQIKNTISRNSLHLISFSRKATISIIWIQNWREFRYKDHMYDVVQSISDADSIRFYCIDDTQEANLFVHLNQLVKNQMDKDFGLQTSITHRFLKTFLSSVYLSATSNYSIIKNCSVENYFVYTSNFSEGYLKKLSPPPKIVS